MRFYTKSANRHGGESDTYQAHVSRVSGDEIALKLTWPTRFGGTQHGELSLEPDGARWLAYALLKALEEGTETVMTMEQGARGH